MGVPVWLVLMDVLLVTLNVWEVAQNVWLILLLPQCVVHQIMEKKENGNLLMVNGSSWKLNHKDQKVKVKMMMVPLLNLVVNPVLVMVVPLTSLNSSLPF